MAIQQGTTTAFKLSLYDRLKTDVVKMALYTGLATLSQETLAYTTTDEVTGGNYVAGGVTLTNVQVSSDSSGHVYVTFDNPTWTDVSFVARGALIYDVTLANLAVAVLDFGADKQAGPNFTVQLPANTASTALLRCN